MWQEKKFSSINVVGGGTKDRLLCQLAANACKVPVIAGPIEATVLGNVAVQLMALGEISSLKDARQIVANSFDTIEYQPVDTQKWDESYQQFVKIVR